MRKRIYRRCPIVTALNLDNELVKEAIKLGKFKTKTQAVNTALAEYIQLQKRRDLVAIAGTINYRADYDYKKLRSRKSK
jgi:Arc/MetJ family transcription regulator